MGWARAAPALTSPSPVEAQRQKVVEEELRPSEVERGAAA
jgi:hypothetical protein